MTQQDPKVAERLAKLRAKMATVDTGGAKGFWSPPSGDSIIRILPEVGDMEFFFQEVGSHYIPGEKSMSIYCPNFTSGGMHDCPICELVGELWRGDEMDKELAKKLRHDRKFWMNVVVRDKDDAGGNTASGPYIFTPGVTIYNAILALINNPTIGDITDIDTGIDLLINKKGEKLNTEYQVFNRPSRVDIPLCKDEQKLNNILDKAQDLSWVMLSEDKDEDKDLGAGKIVRLLPYNRMLDEYGIGPGMDVSKLEAKVQSQPQSSPSQVRETLRQKREEPSEEALPVDEVGVQFQQLRGRRR